MTYCDSCSGCFISFGGVTVGGPGVNYELIRDAMELWSFGGQREEIITREDHRINYSGDGYSVTFSFRRGDTAPPIARAYDGCTLSVPPGTTLAIVHFAAREGIKDDTLEYLLSRSEYSGSRFSQAWQRATPVIMESLGGYRHTELARRISEARWAC